MDRRKNTKTFKNYSNLILILIIMMVMNAGAATFTSTLPMEPDTPVFPFGGEFTITLPAGFLDIELKDNEYFVYPPKTNYQWTVQSIESGTNGNGNSGSGIVRSGEGLTATIVSDEVGGSGVISAPGKYKVTFSGSVTYTIGWRVDGVEMTSGPHTETLRASHGGRLSMDFWLVAVDRIEISGNGASGVVSDATTTLLCGTKYTFTAYRNPANSPGWPSGFPYWAASSGIGLVANGDQAVCTFYSPDTALILNTWCGWGFYKQAVFKVVKPQIQVVEFPRIDIYDKDDRWQAPVGGLQAKNDPACFIQNQKSMVNVKFYCSENLTFPVTVSIRGDVHGFDEYITGDDYGRDNMVFATDWSRYGEIESESFTEAKIKDDYDVDISWRYKVRAPNGSDEWINVGDTDNLTYYLVWDEPQYPQEEPWNGVLEKAVAWAEGDESASEALGHVTQAVYNSGFLYSPYPRFYFVSSIIGKKYLLSECLANWGQGYINCFDTAVIKNIFANALGCNVQAKRIYPSFEVNYIKPIGSSTWTNDPCQNGSHSFAQHFVAYLNGYYDGCLMVDSDDSPDSAPHISILPKGMSYFNYMSKLVKPIYIYTSNTQDEMIPPCF